MTAAISVSGLGKEYRLGETVTSSLRELLAAPTQWLRRRPPPESFWALEDISFEIRPGEVVGVIGRNGAGKSTLLKLMSRITSPTTGSIRLRGRLTSLLEVGTGFHPELTGRENVFLNGAIMGMRKREIARKFDEIVAFADVERFLDTPVKRYSSGMYVRLAFAVAAHLEPDILIIDEVLAVGDAQFQKKCLGKIENVAGSGRTVMFVSHNMATMAALCTRALYLSDGRLRFDGPVRGAIDMHLNALDQLGGGSLAEREDRSGDGRLRFTSFWLENGRGQTLPTALLGDTVVICLAFQAHVDLEHVYVAFDIRDQLGEAVSNCNTADVGSDFAEVKAGAGVFRCQLPRFPIRAGRYHGNVYCSTRGQVNDFLQAGIVIEVEDGDFYGTGSLRNPCRVMLDQQWSVHGKTDSQSSAARDAESAIMTGAIS